MKPADREFLNIIDCYSSLKNKIISQKEYLDVKKLFETLKMRDMGDLNELYNFQDTITLCGISESRLSLMNEKYK